MSKYIIDTEAGTCQQYDMPMKTSDLVDFLVQYEGAKEYDSVVSAIQKWYYGTLVKAPWCATCMSWAFHKLGIPVDKSENVYTLMRNCQYAATQGNGTFYSKSEIPELKRGDVCFLLFSGATMTTTSKKHVTAYVKDAENERIRCIGGNQSNQIKVSDYDRRTLYAVYRP